MIELKVVGENEALFFQRLRNIVLPLLGGVSNQPTSADEPKTVDAVVEQPKQEAKTKREPKAKKAEPTSGTELKQPETKTEEPEGEKPTIEAIRAALQGLAKAKGDDAVFTLLGKYDAKNATTLLASPKVAEALAEAKKLTEAE